MDRNLTRGRDLAMHGAIFLIAFLLLFARRPDAILHAQFYAEDGAYFYSDAYQFGWRCLLMPYGGYLSTLLRLIGLLAQLVPFGLAPLVMNLCAIAIQILPVNLFLSARFKAISYNVRLFASLLYLAIPNAFEIHANTTNIQWHLALLALLVLLSQAEAAKAWRYFDYAVLFFCTTRRAPRNFVGPYRSIFALASQRQAHRAGPRGHDSVGRSSVSIHPVFKFAAPRSQWRFLRTIGWNSWRTNFLLCHIRFEKFHSTFHQSRTLVTVD